jgi:3-methyl-2-oxobutanoate hydroxymethyltransferase
VHQLGGYRVQGRTEVEARRLLQDAHALQQAGASLLVLECVPRDLAAQISKELLIPVIGIGAGVGCDGQVLVLHDILGINVGKAPSFTKNFLANSGSIQAALQAFVTEVKNGQFPGIEHGYN